MTPDDVDELGDPKEKLILLVDDDESILDLMEHVIGKEGFRLERAMDGHAAVKKARSLSPDLIILDFMLPGIGGFEVLRELQMGDTTTIPVLVISGRHMERTALEMIRQEVNVRDFQEKPIRPALLTTTLHRLLKTRPPDLDRKPSRGPLSKEW